MHTETQILEGEKKNNNKKNVSFSFLLQGWFSPGQVFVLDEYCARYGVRGCHRHLCYLTELMEHSENGAVIDPTLLHYSFAFCASHVHGNRYFDLQILSEMYRVAWKMGRMCFAIIT